MRDDAKTKKQLINELKGLRTRFDEMETAAARWREEEQRLRASHDLFSQALFTSPHLITINSRSDDRYLEVNDAFLKATGYERDEIIGRSALDLNLWADPKDHDRMVQEIEEKGAARNQEVAFRRKSGQIGVVQMNAEPVTIGDERCVITISKDVTAQRAAEAELRKSEDKYRLVVENTSEAICIVQDGEIVFVNSRLSELYGYALGEVLGRSFTDFIHPEDLAPVFDRYTRRLAGEPLERIAECRLIDKEGAVRWTEFNSDLIEWEGRSAILSLFRDVTDRKQAEEALQESEDNLRMMVESASGFAVYQLAYDPEDPFLARMVFVSPSVQDLLGLTQTANLGDLFSKMHPEDSGRVAAANQHSWATGQTLNETFRFYHPVKQEWRWFQVIANGKIDPREEASRCNGILIDVTLRRRAEEALQEAHDLLETRVKERTADLEAANARLQQEVEDRRLAGEKLRESEERYRFLAENMADIVWTLDLNFKTTYVSPSVEKVLGFTPEERKQQALEEMITPESFQRVTARLVEEFRLEEEQRADPERSLTMEVEYYHRDGSIVWIENSVKALRDEAGVLVGMYGSSRDITQRKRAEEERERLIGELQDALVKVKTLRGLIPICSNCKKVREDTGYWKQVEVYVREHSEAEFSHGICPECMKILYPAVKKDNGD